MNDMDSFEWLLCHGPQAGAAIVSVDQLQVIGGRPGGSNRLIDHLDGLILRHPVQVDFDKRFIHSAISPDGPPYYNC